jgi:hypothetical protein
MERKEYTMFDNAFWTTGSTYNGMSNKDKHHCLINKSTGERISLVPMMENSRTTTLKNTKISARIIQRLVI